MDEMPVKQSIERPLGKKCYGSIGHLPGSRLGPGDHSISEGQAKILLEKPRDKHDLIVVQEKLDGSNVGVARIDGVIVPLIRAGYKAQESTHLQHRYFANWVFENQERFDFLQERWRICGEWLAQVHSIRYQIYDGPFFAFDIFNEKDERMLFKDMQKVCLDSGIDQPFVLHIGNAGYSVEQADKKLGTYGHCGAMDPTEGAVWRVERKGKVDFLGKYVRKDKVDGTYFDNVTWNWTPKNEVKT